MSSFCKRSGLALLVFWVGACATTAESRVGQELEIARKQFELRPAPESPISFDGSLGGYVAFALQHSPEARASFEQWRAQTLAIAKARRLPEPSVSFGAFLRRVETRVGAQRFKLGLSQTFPWPTKLSARADAASALARAAQSSFDAEMLAVRARIAEVYWQLWLIREEHRIKSEHDSVLEALTAAVRGRLKANAATLADLNQIELNVARHHDHRGAHAEATRKASAALLATLGIEGDGRELIAIDNPSPGLPILPNGELRSLARAHPQIERHGHLADGAKRRADAEGADRLPQFRLSLDYIETAEAETPGVPGSGRDPIVVGLGLSIPLWTGSYRDAEESARASARASEANGQAAERRAEAAVEAGVAQVRDAQRRIELYETTLVRQANSTLHAVLGSYQSGRSTVAAVILAQRDLLDLQLEFARARAEHATAWTRLEFVVGRELERKEPSR